MPELSDVVEGLTYGRSMRAQRIWAVSAIAGVLLLLAGPWLLVDNVSVDITASDYDDISATGEMMPAGQTGCSIAPYDAGFYGNDQPPGGERRKAFSDEMAVDCYSANMQRFRVAIACLVLGAVLVVASFVLHVRSTRNST